jgi:ArsR family transcriptional regulator
MINKSKIRFNQDDLDYSVELMKALAHPLRLKILEFIDTQEVINVNKIYNTLKIEQSITSQHLRILRLAGVVNAKREGKFIYYDINYDVVKKASIAVNNFLHSTVKAR